MNSFQLGTCFLILLCTFGCERPVKQFGLVDLLGTWNSKCVLTGKMSNKQSISFTQSHMLVQLQKFSDTSCAVPTLTVTLEYIFLEGMTPVSIPSDARSLDGTVISVTNTPTNNAIAKELTTTYGVPHTAGKTTLVTGRNGLATQGTIFYGIYKIDGSTLYIGDSDSPDPDKRPNKYSTTIFTKL